MFHKALRAVKDSSNPKGGLWPSCHSLLFSSWHLFSPSLSVSFYTHPLIWVQIESAAELSSSGFSFTSPISPITLSARPSACPSASFSQRKNHHYLSKTCPFQMYSTLGSVCLRWLSCLFACYLAGWLQSLLVATWPVGSFKVPKWWIPQWMRSRQMAWPPCEREGRRRRGCELTEGPCVTTHQSSEQHAEEHGPTETHNIPIHTKQGLWIIMFRDPSCRSKQAGAMLVTFIKSHV